MLLIKPTGRGGGRFPGRRLRRFRKQRLTDKQKDKVFDKWVGIIRASAVNARVLIAKNQKATNLLKESVSEAISPVKLDAYIEKRNSGEIFLIAFAVIGFNLLKPEAAALGRSTVEVVPDGFLTGEERFALQRVRDIPQRRVLTISEFKQWAMKNVDFAAVADAFNL